MINAFEKEVLYLTAFDTDKLLAGFRETAGVDMRGAERYPGWESMLIGGHTLGHFMTACVRCCESANCKEEDRQKMLQILKKILKFQWQWALMVQDYTKKYLIEAFYIMLTN